MFEQFGFWMKKLIHKILSVSAIWLKNKQRYNFWSVLPSPSRHQEAWKNHHVVIKGIQTTMSVTFPTLPFTHTHLYTHTAAGLYKHACTQLHSWPIRVLDLFETYSFSTSEGHLYEIKEKDMHSPMYNIICILTILLYIHTNSFFCDNVQEVKFIKVIFLVFFFLFSYLIKS